MCIENAAPSFDAAPSSASSICLPSMTTPTLASNVAESSWPAPARPAAGAPERACLPRCCSRRGGTLRRPRVTRQPDHGTGIGAGRRGCIPHLVRSARGRRARPSRCGRRCRMRRRSGSSMLAARQDEVRGGGRLGGAADDGGRDPARRRPDGARGHLGAYCAFLNLPEARPDGNIESKTNFFAAVRRGRSRRLPALHPTIFRPTSTTRRASLPVTQPPSPPPVWKARSRPGGRGPRRRPRPHGSRAAAATATEPTRCLQVGRPTRVPVDGDEHVRRLSELRRRVERVDQDEPVVRVDRERADVLLPVVVPGGPAAEAGRDLLHQL